MSSTALWKKIDRLPQDGGYMTIQKIKDELSRTSYPGRGIIAGKSEDGKYAVSATFIFFVEESKKLYCCVHIHNLHSLESLSTTP